MAEPPLELREIVNLLFHRASQWRSVGIQLGVPHTVLNTIQYDNAQYPDMCQRCLENVVCWYLRQGHDLTKSDIISLKASVGYSSKFLVFSAVLLVIPAFLCAYLFTEINPVNRYEVHSPSLINSTLTPLPFPPFVGREKECNDIIALLDFESSLTTAVSLVAPFGYGKTELAKEVGNRAMAGGEVSVQYIDLKGVNDTVMFDDNIIMHLAIAAGIYSGDVEDIKLPMLAGKLTWQTLLILDNCDAMFSSAENDLHFQEFLEDALWLFSPLLKLLTTSRRRPPFLNANIKVYFLSSLSTDFAVEFLVQLGVPSDDILILEDISREVENVPYSLRAVGMELKLPSLINPQVMYSQLMYNNHIDILAPHLKHKAESSIYMTYRQITPSRDCRKWSYWFITNAPSHSMPMWSDNLFCLNELVKHSVILEDVITESDTSDMHQTVVDEPSSMTYYRVPRLEREFYQYTLGKSPIYIAYRPDVSLNNLLLDGYITENTMLT